MEIDEISEDEILCELKMEIKAAKNMYTWARDNGLCGEQVADIVKGRHKMQPKVAAVLGYSPVRKWVKNVD